MTLFFRNLVTAALILVLAGGGLHAEERQLNDAGIQELKPILQAEAAALTASRALAVSQANANIYRKHAVQLGPLLDALVPQP